MIFYLLSIFSSVVKHGQRKLLPRTGVSSPSSQIRILFSFLYVVIFGFIIVFVCFIFILCVFFFIYLFILFSLTSDIIPFAIFVYTSTRLNGSTLLESHI